MTDTAENTTTGRTFGVPTGRATGDVEFIRASKLKEDGFTGLLLEGQYLENIPNQLNKDRLDYKFKKDDGSVVVINGAGNLGYKMEFVEVGDYVQIEYLGMKEIAGGSFKGKMSHDFEVLTENGGDGEAA